MQRGGGAIEADIGGESPDGASASSPCEIGALVDETAREQRVEKIGFGRVIGHYVLGFREV